jgi:hypothetical protein
MSNLLDLPEWHWHQLREYHLEMCDQWQRGDKQTMGQPKDNLTGGYEWAMRGSIAHHEECLYEMGAYGNDDYSQRHKHKTDA